MEDKNVIRNSIIVACFIAGFIKLWLDIFGDSSISVNPMLILTWFLAWRLSEMLDKK